MPSSNEKSSRTLTIDFKSIEGPVYTGRARGEALREQYRLDSTEHDMDVVVVLIPPLSYSMSSGFFLGLFGPSIREAGTAAAFKSKFRFSAPAFLLPQLDEHISKAVGPRFGMQQEQH